MSDGDMTEPSRNALTSEARGLTERADHLSALAAALLERGHDILAGQIQDEASRVYAEAFLLTLRSETIGRQGDPDPA